MRDLTESPQIKSVAVERSAEQAPVSTTLGLPNLPSREKLDQMEWSSAGISDLRLGKRELSPREAVDQAKRIVGILDSGGENVRATARQTLTGQTLGDVLAISRAYAGFTDHRDLLSDIRLPGSRSSASASNEPLESAGKVALDPPTRIAQVVNEQLSNGAQPSSSLAAIHTAGDMSYLKEKLRTDGGVIFNFSDNNTVLVWSSPQGGQKGGTYFGGPQAKEINEFATTLGERSATVPVVNVPAPFVAAPHDSNLMKTLQGYSSSELRKVKS